MRDFRKLDIASQLRQITATVLAVLSLASLSPVALAASADSSIPVAPKRTSRLNGSVNQSGPARLYRPTASMTPVTGSNYLMSQPGSVPPEPSGSVVSGADMSAFSSVPAATGNSASSAPDYSAFSSPPAGNSYSSGANSSSGANFNSSAANSSSSKHSFDAEKALELGVALASQIGHYVGQERAAQQVLRSAATQATSVTAARSPVVRGLANATGYTTKYAKQLTKQEIGQLSKYDVVVVIDKSGSMDEHDCPGGMSRWQWCQTQLLSFTSQIDSAFRNGITVALFSSDYQIFNNVNFGYVQNIFANNSPGGGTYTGKVMSAVFDDYFARRQANPAATRKLLVQVITDGDPSDKGKLIETICKASQNINSQDEITVNFLQIGSDRDGERTLAKLDTGLIDEGAQYDIVKVEPFSAVETEGLPRAVMDATH